MNCDKVKELIPFLDDGSLDEASEREVREHLKTCVECRNEYEEVTFVVNLAKKSFSEKPVVEPADLMEKVKQGIEHEKRAKKVHLWMYSAAAAVFFAAVMSLYFMVTDTQPERISGQTVVERPKGTATRYYAEYFLDSYDLIELVDVSANGHDSTLEDALLEDNVLDISVYEMIDTFDSF